MEGQRCGTANFSHFANESDVYLSTSDSIDNENTKNEDGGIALDYDTAQRLHNSMPLSKMVFEFSTLNCPGYFARF